MQKSDNDNDNDNESGKTSRRNLLGLALLGGGALFSVIKSQAAKADIVGADAAGITELALWLKSIYVTNILPTLKTIKDTYDTAKSWVDTWNTFVHDYNEAMDFVNDVLTTLTDPQENIFYLQLKQIIDYVDKMLSPQGGFLKYRLRYLNPVLFQKLDSYIFQGESFNYRAQHLGMLKYFRQDDESKISDDKKKNFINNIFPNTNMAKTAIRISNDIANYGVSALKIEALKQTVNEMKTAVGAIPSQPGKPAKGMAPQKSRGQVFQELSAVTHVDILLEQLTILNEISFKLTNLMLVNTETGQGPFVSDKEGYITKEMFSKIKESLFQSAGDTDHSIFKMNMDNKNSRVINKK